MSFHEDKFRTIDGVELHARIYSALKPGPGLVMCPGFNCILTMMNFPECAQALQERGITVLLYDPRSTGTSGGEPRNDIDPPQGVSDLSDALTHLLAQPMVESAGLLGYSFGGTTALSAAALDPRCVFAVAAAALTDLDFVSAAQRTRVLRRCARDRESQALGNAPHTVPLVTERGESAVGFGRGIDAARYGALVLAGRPLAPGHVNRVTLMSYYRLAMWTPWPLWVRLGRRDDECARPGAAAGLRGVMFVIPTEDAMSYPGMQRKFYDEIEARSSFHKAKLEVEGAGHEELFDEKHLDSVVVSIVRFIEQAVGWKM